MYSEVERIILGIISQFASTRPKFFMKDCATFMEPMRLFFFLSLLNYLIMRRMFPQYKTSTGRLRFFLRFCLVHNCLADTIQQCLTHSDVTNDYYNPDSFLGNSHFCSQFITALYEINDIQFDLAPTGYELDVGWPTFAR